MPKKKSDYDCIKESFCPGCNDCEFLCNLRKKGNKRMKSMTQKQLNKDLLNFVRLEITNKSNCPVYNGHIVGLHTPTNNSVFIDPNFNTLSKRKCLNKLIKHGAVVSTNIAYNCILLAIRFESPLLFFKALEKNNCFDIDLINKEINNSFKEWKRTCWYGKIFPLNDHLNLIQELDQHGFNYRIDDLEKYFDHYINLTHNYFPIKNKKNKRFLQFYISKSVKLKDSYLKRLFVKEFVELKKIGYNQHTYKQYLCLLIDSNNYTRIADYLSIVFRKRKNKILFNPEGSELPLNYVSLKNLNMNLLSRYSYYFRLKKKIGETMEIYKLFKKLCFVGLSTKIFNEKGLAKKIVSYL